MKPISIKAIPHHGSVIPKNGGTQIIPAASSNVSMIVLIIVYIVCQRADFALTIFLY